MRTIILFFIWLSLSASALSQNLVAYYPFNGNANDESITGNNATVNGATLAADRNGSINKAYDFNGSTNWLQAPDNPVLDFGNGDFSITSFINAVSYTHLTLPTNRE